MGTCMSFRNADSKKEVVTDSRGFPLLRKPAFLSLPNSKPEKVRKADFVGMLQDPSSYLVYLRFEEESDLASQFFYALDIKEMKYLPLPNYPVDTYANSTSSVLDNKLYVIGGTRGPHVSNAVHVFDPLSNAWSGPIRASVPRRAAVAASVDGRVYVFGGCDIRNEEWGEFYNPSTDTWTPIPGSEALRTHNIGMGLTPLLTCAVLGKNVILRGWSRAISFDVTTASWSRPSANLIENWFSSASGAVVQNLLITCYSKRSGNPNQRSSIRAYDPDQDVWLMLQGIDCRYHENAKKCDFTSVNGKLVIYQLWYQEHLGFSVFEIKERHQTSVRANLLWQSCFPIRKVIKKGRHNSRGRYKHTLVEAIRQDDSES